MVTPRHPFFYEKNLTGGAGRGRKKEKMRATGVTVFRIIDRRKEEACFDCDFQGLTNGRELCILAVAMASRMTACRFPTQQVVVCFRRIGRS